MSKKRFVKGLMKEIREVLNEWDPIGAEGFKSPSDEYDTYIPMILKYTSDKKLLIKYLEYMLTEKIGLPYNPDNHEHKKDVERIADRLMSVWSAST